MAFLNTDKLWYIAFYTDNGDFAKLSEKGYETVELANASAGIPEGTPAGELVQDDVILEAETKVAETPVEATPETAPEVAPEAPATAEATATTEPTTEPTAEPVAPVVDTNQPETPVAPESTPVAPETVPAEPVAPVEPTPAPEVTA